MKLIFLLKSYLGTPIHTFLIPWVVWLVGYIIWKGLTKYYEYILFF